MTLAFIVVTSPADRKPSCFSKDDIVIDGQEAALIWRGKTARLQVAPGEHRVQIRALTSSAISSSTSSAA
jgi:hypothetical protein